MGTHPIFESDFDCLTAKMRGDVTEQETLLLRLYKQLSQRKAELEQIRQEKINAEKNVAPLVKKAPITKQLTKEETQRMVANASSATERAKALLAQGKLKIEQKQSSGFKRRPGGGGARKRPLEMDQSKRPKIEMPAYADDNDGDNHFEHIPSGEVDMKPETTKQPIQRKPVIKRQKPAPPKREAVVYDDLFD